MVRTRQRFAAAVSMLLTTCAATAAVTAALAQQPRPPHARPKPKPAATDDNPYADTPVPAASPSAVDGGLGPVPPPRSDMGDGGVKPSPLNPATNEMPETPGVPGVAPMPASSAAVDYDKLLADIASLRARVSAVGDNLFTSRIAIGVQTESDHGSVARFVVSLDDGVVFTAPAGYHPEDVATIYEHSVSPGRHAVTVDVDRRDQRDDSFRSEQRSRFIVDVPKDQRLTVSLRVGDDSNMGANFPVDRKGTYDLRVRMKAAAGPATTAKR